MSYNTWLLLTDIGIIGSISALIVSVGILLGRREETVRSVPSDRPADAREELTRRAS